MRKVNAFDWQTGKVTYENVTFHQFGLEVVEHEQGTSSYSVAILELDNGNVVTWGVNYIQFIDDANQNINIDNKSEAAA